MNETKQKTLISFKKAQSHIGKIIKMMESDAYCIDIMQQNLAVIGLLKSAHQRLMENHLNTCFKDAICHEDKTKQKQMVQEMLQVSKLFNK